MIRAILARLGLTTRAELLAQQERANRAELFADRLIQVAKDRGVVVFDSAVCHFGQTSFDGPVIISPKVRSVSFHQCYMEGRTL